MPTLKIGDRGEYLLEKYLTHSLMTKYSRQVFQEFNQLLDKKLCLGFNNESIKISPIQATSLLRESIEIIEKELIDWAQGYSPMRWLWMLRRLPNFVFSGELKSTASYDQTLAEILSAKSRNTSCRILINQNQIYYDISGNVPKRLARFCSGIRYLSSLHSDLRWAGKGSEFLLSQVSFLERVANKDLEKAVELYDRRHISYGMPLPRGGTKLADLPNLPSDDFFILRVNGGVSSLVEISNKIMQSLGSGYSSDTEWSFYARFYPCFISLSPLRELQGKNVLIKAEIWSDEAILILFLLRVSLIFVHEHSSGYFGILKRGYLMIPKKRFFELAQISIESQISWIKTNLKRDFELSSGTDFLKRLESIQGSQHPMIPGPVVRVEKDFILLDLAIASYRLDSSFEYLDKQGIQANARAFHFELVVQKMIDSSQWKPRHEIAELRGRTLRYEGKKITDLDCIGQKNKTLLIIDCKSIVYSSKYDSGDFKTVRNVQNEVINKVQKWQEVKEKIRAFPVGDNYDLSKFSEILAIVCTPMVFFTPIGLATKEIEPGLRLSSSLVELEEWLNS